MAPIYMKVQRINDNHLSNDREATSCLPTLALILPVRVSEEHIHTYTHTLTIHKAALPWTLLLRCVGAIMLNFGFHYTQGRVIRVTESRNH